MITDEQALSWVDRYQSVRWLLLDHLSKVSEVEEDLDEVLRVQLFRHRLAVLNQLARIEGRFAVIQGNHPS